MNLKDALLCINCDEVFKAAGSRVNPRCPICASSVFAPLSAWVGTWTALEKDGMNRLMRDGVPTERPRMKVVHATTIAA